MREIKFRAWARDKSLFRYFLLVVRRIEFDDRGKITNLICYRNGSYEYPSTYTNDTFIIEQFTGLHDKNGKEIYEGDIVNARYHNLSVEVDGVPRVVHMGQAEDSDGWAHGDWMGWKAGENSLLDVHKDCEIIGNIHENPELVDGK